jgi:hypothetical protein
VQKKIGSLKLFFEGNLNIFTCFLLSKKQFFILFMAALTEPKGERQGLFRLLRSSGIQGWI